MCNTVVQHDWPQKPNGLLYAHPCHIAVLHMTTRKSNLRNSREIRLLACTVMTHSLCTCVTRTCECWYLILNSLRFSVCNHSKRQVPRRGIDTRTEYLVSYRCLNWRSIGESSLPTVELFAASWDSMPQGSIMSFFKKCVSSACLPHTDCGSFPQAQDRRRRGRDTR